MQSILEEVQVMDGFYHIVPIHQVKVTTTQLVQLDLYRTQHNDLIAV